MNDVVASAVAHLVIPMLLPEIAAAGAKVDWRGIKSRIDVKLQQLIPLHWIEVRVQTGVDAVIGGVQVASQDSAGLQTVLEALAAGDVVGAEAALIAMVRKDAPQVAVLLPAA